MQITSNHLIRVLCVDDYRLVREGLGLIIDRQADMRVVGMAATAEDALDLFRRHLPDVTLMDLRLRGTSGVEGIRLIRREHPQARLVATTFHEGSEDIHRALSAGAIAYVLKDAASSDLVRIVRDVHLGGRPLSPDLEAKMSLAAGRAALTQREAEVMGLLVQGMRNKEIAWTLCNRESTVQVHVKNIFLKLGVKDRTAAVSVALRRGIVPLDNME